MSFSICRHYMPNEGMTNHLNAREVLVLYRKRE